MFWLSPEGKQELNGLIESDKGSFRAFVVAEHELGIWIRLAKGGAKESGPSLLLKWHHFSTAVVDFKPKSGSRRAGFR